MDRCIRYPPFCIPFCRGTGRGVLYLVYLYFFTEKEFLWNRTTKLSMVKTLLQNF